MDILFYFKQNPEKYYEAERVWQDLCQTCAFLSTSLKRESSEEDYDMIHFVDVDSEMKVEEAIHKKVILVCSILYGENDYGSIMKYDAIGGYGLRKKAYRILNKMDLILVPNDYAKVLLKSQGITSPILAIANHINIDYFEGNKELNTMLFRRYYNVLRDTKVIVVSLSTHSDVGWKRAHQLAKKHPEYRFFYFGKPRYAYYNKKARNSMKKPYKNEIFCGIVDENLYMSALLCASAFLSLEDQYSGSVSLSEAMAAHCPIVASEKGIQFSPWLSKQTACLFRNENDLEEEFLKAVGEEGTLRAEKAFQLVKEYSEKEESEQIKKAYEIVWQKGEKKK